jgi:hypothetical protein
LFERAASIYRNYSYGTTADLLVNFHRLYNRDHSDNLDLGHFSPSIYNGNKDRYVYGHLDRDILLTCGNVSSVITTPFTWSLWPSMCDTRKCLEMFKIEVSAITGACDGNTIFNMSLYSSAFVVTLGFHVCPGIGVSVPLPGKYMRLRAICFRA